MASEDTAAIATRYDKQAANYPAAVKLAASRIWSKTYESVTYRVIASPALHRA